MFFRVFLINFTEITQYLNLDDIISICEILNIFPYRCNYDKIEIHNKKHLSLVKNNYFHFNYLHLRIFNSSKLNRLKINPSIISLHIGNNINIKLPNLKNLYNLKHLSIMYTNLKFMKQKLPSQLISLNLSSNRIKDLNYVNHITRLKKLDFSFNLISNINVQIDLTSLTFLNLEENAIEKIENLNTPNLIVLNLSDNRIIKIENLGKLTKLEKLDMSNNLIGTIENMQHLKNLIHLNLSFNVIQEIQNIDHLCKLKLLNLSNNTISKIINLDNLKNLVELNLCYNFIRVLENIGSLLSLKYIDLSYNAIFISQNAKIPPNLEFLLATV